MRTGVDLNGNNVGLKNHKFRIPSFLMQIIRLEINEKSY